MRKLPLFPSPREGTQASGEQHKASETEGLPLTEFVVQNTKGEVEGTLENEKILTARKLAKSFCQQPYPLTLQGENLKALLTALLQARDDQKLLEMFDQIPTVESPRLELFRDLNFTPNQEFELFLHPGITNIQVTKGCSHKCTFCAASAKEGVDHMPFMAILKIEQAKKTFYQKLRNLREEINVMAAEKKDGGVLEVLMEQREALIARGFSPQLLDDLLQKLRSFFALEDQYMAGLDIPLSSKAYEDYQTILYCLPDDIDEEVGHEGIEAIYKGILGLLEHYKDTERPQRGDQQSRSLAQDVAAILWNRKQLFPTFETLLFVYAGRDKSPTTNYYDSDPLDYRDKNFLHADGTMADFGDVVELLTQTQLVHVTTAGWNPKDKIAGKAARKIARIAKSKLPNLRLSVNPYEVQALKSYERYLESITENVEILTPVLREVLFFLRSTLTEVGGKKYYKTDPEHQRFHLEVVVPIVRMIEKHNKSLGLRADSSYIKIIYATVSDFSGPSAVKGSEDHDVMACMPGLHIWPDGTVSLQAGSNLDKVPLGSRPTPTGAKLPFGVA